MRHEGYKLFACVYLSGRVTGEWRYDITSCKHSKRVHMRDKIGNIGICRLRIYFLRCATLDDPATLHDRNTPTDFEGFIKVVAHKDDRSTKAGLQLKKFILEAGANERIES